MATKLNLFSSCFLRQPEALFQLEWHNQNNIKLFSAWSGSSPNLNLIELLWLQIKQLQNWGCATSDVGLKRIVLSIEEGHAIFPEIAVQEHAKKNASCGLGPGLSYQVLSQHR